ncbi:porin [Labrys sp. 22185]|uniref:porin n=1 Tax=Labrys sp. 22185 TaxID=3453888 RepID=UPI003F84556C
MKAVAIGLAGAILGAGAAHAQDLPVGKGAPDSYLQACVDMGVGFWQLPGSDTCVKISGEVRADYVVSRQRTREDDFSGFVTRGQIGFDARTDTDYGLLRSFFLIDAYVGPRTTTEFVIDKAFLQFGGLTAGYAHSFFGIYDLDYGNDLLQPYFGYAATTNLIAYTQEFGGGLSATLSLEDARGTRSDVLNFFGFPDPRRPAGGTAMPDIVGNVRLDRDWGTLAVFGAGHQVRYPGPPQIGGSDYGYAVGAAFGLNLPIRSGAHIAVEGTYANGASAYLGWQQIDAAYENFSGRKDIGRGWTVTGEAGINITPALTLNLLGSYLDYSAATTRDYVNPAAPDVRGWVAGGNAVYTVTRGLSFGIEGFYSSYRAKGGQDFFPYEEDIRGWTGVLRVRRTF